MFEINHANHFDNLKIINYRYSLTPYTKDDKSGARHKHVNVSEDEFKKWLSSYREEVTKAENNEEDDGYY